MTMPFIYSGLKRSSAPLFKKERRGGYLASYLLGF
jgi:hypothetical protein